MSFTERNPINILYSCMLIIDVFLIGSYPLLKGTWSESYLMYGLWAVVFGMLFFSIFADIKTGTRSGFGYYIAIIALLICNIVFPIGKKADLIIAALTFFVMFFPFYYTQHMNKSNALVNLIEGCTLAKAIIFIIYSFTPFAYAGFYADGEYIQNGQMTLGYSNPNTTAIHLFCTFSILFYLFGLEKNRSRFKKVGVFLILVSLGYLIICTGSRLEISCTVAMVVLRYLWSGNKIKKVLTSRWFLVIVLLLPLVFLWGYFKLYTTMPGDYMVMGRSIFARISIYQDALTSVKSNLLFGNMNVWLFTNSHNGLLTILVNIGVVGLAIYLLFLFKSLFRYASFLRTNRYSNPVPYFMVIIFLIQACAESSSLAGGVSFMSGAAVAAYLCEINSVELGNNVNS